MEDGEEEEEKGQLARAARVEEGDRRGEGVEAHTQCTGLSM
jgi:hypothetical protein